MCKGVEASADTNIDKYFHTSSTYTPMLIHIMYIHKYTHSTYLHTRHHCVGKNTTNVYAEVHANVPAAVFH